MSRVDACARAAWSRMPRVFDGGASMKTRRGLALVAVVIATTVSLCGVSMRAQQLGAVGMFEKSQDVGTVLHPGPVTYEPTSHTYSLTASGENIWSTQDAFQFA